MASELRVNTLKDASGANSVATSVVASGSAKAWANLNGVSFGLRDDFNFSSATDVGTGDYDFIFTNNMANANYAAAAIGNGSGFSNSMPNLDGAITTSTIPIRTLNTADTKQDTDHILLSVHGDLA